MRKARRGWVINYGGEITSSGMNNSDPSQKARDTPLRRKVINEHGDPSAAIFVLDVEATGAVSSYRRAETFLLAIIIAVFVLKIWQSCDAAVEDEPAPQRNPVSAECGVTSSVLAAARSRGAAPRRCGRSAP